MAGKEVTVWVAYCTFVENLAGGGTHEELRVISIPAVETEKQLTLKRRHPVTFQVRGVPGQFAHTREKALASYLAGLESHRASLTVQLSQVITRIALVNAEIAASTQEKSPDAE